ncbi:MAG: ATP-binding protein [Anaerolineaceae bacterium]|nr:ATP-binding protein [Anaerolineaceae bacterium]
MSTSKLPKRVSTAVLQSLSAGVVPRAGLEHIAVGRKAEIEALLDDTDNIVAEGGASFRMILGRYGSGKSFLCQLIRNYALQRNFVVMDADLSPQHRLTGTQGQGLNLYRSLLTNAATKTRPDGGAFSALLERWISDMQQQVIQKEGLKINDPSFSTAVENTIRMTISQMEGMVHSFDFSTVISTYWQGHQSGDDTQKESALRWLRGEYSTKTEAREALGVRVIIDDDSWYDYIKLLAHFVKDIGYKGLIIFIDEAVNLYKISNTVSRNNNYERLLTIFNDTMQGKAQYLGIILGATNQMVEDTRRGLFSYEALRSRLEESRFSKNGFRDLSGPMIRLEVLTPEEVFVLLQRIREIHGLHYGYQSTVQDKQIEFFLNEVRKRLGADQLITPREIVRDFIAVLNILQQNPELTFDSLISGEDFKPTRSSGDPEALTPETEISDDGNDISSPYKSFEL